MILKKAALLALGTFLWVGIAGAQVIATGEQAQQMYEQIPGPDGQEYCTGLCLPNHPCDPTCTSIKRADGYFCARTRHTKTGEIDYTCETSGTEE
jgi:hypothetical protein